MRLLIFGANGKIGKLLTQTALNDGHEVTAFVRKVRKDNSSQTNLTHVEGDATDPEAVAKAMPGQDAVISVLGHNRRTQVEMQSEAMRAITAAMGKHGVERIISLTGSAVYTTGDTPTIIDKLAASALTFIDLKRIQDGVKHVEVLKDSGLDWAVLRTPKHRDGKQVTNYNLDPNLTSLILSVSRPNIVDALLHLATVEKLPSRMPVISD